MKLRAGMVSSFRLLVYLPLTIYTASHGPRNREEMVCNCNSPATVLWPVAPIAEFASPTIESLPPRLSLREILRKSNDFQRIAIRCHRTLRRSERGLPLVAVD